MQLACIDGDVVAIVRQLDAGKSVNCADDDGATSITWAIFYCHLDAVVMLAERGADLSRVDSHDGWNLFHLAARGGDCRCINWVLANTNIDINSTDNDGYTPIWWAIDYDNLDAGKLLVEKGANLFKLHGWIAGKAFVLWCHFSCAVDKAPGWVCQHRAETVFTQKIGKVLCSALSHIQHDDLSSLLWKLEQ